ncbi:MAG: Ig domain-containing protein [Enhygromyxa sp.]
MLVQNFSARRFAAENSLCRIAAFAVPMLALALGACSRDELAPDCFEISPETGRCLVPDPGGTAPGINCGTMPEGAVGATYSFTPAVGGGSGSFSMWMASGLPDGLSIDPDTGEISGVPTEAMTYDNVEISMVDDGKGQAFSSECGALVVNEALNPFRVMDEPNHCIPHTASRDDMLALLDGGDGTEITCSPLSNNPNSATCPLGDGNGRLAPGISFSETSCTHSGNVSGDRRGTWVWMVEITQSDYTTRVPFCATNEVDTFHDITVSVDGDAQSDLIPGLFEHNPDADLAFGGGSHQFAIDNPACPGADCNNYGFRFNVTCSPFDVDAPWQVTLSPSASTDTGMTHEMTGTGPVSEPKFDGRPWVASFEMSYCTAGDGGFCDTNDATSFEQNAQTRYHFDVIGYPTN